MFVLYQNSFSSITPNFFDDTPFEPPAYESVTTAIFDSADDLSSFFCMEARPQSSSSELFDEFELIDEKEQREGSFEEEEEASLFFISSSTTPSVPLLEGDASRPPSSIPYLSPKPPMAPALEQPTTPLLDTHLYNSQHPQQHPAAYPFRQEVEFCPAPADPSSFYQQYGPESPHLNNFVQHRNYYYNSTPHPQIYIAHPHPQLQSQPQPVPYISPDPRAYHPPPPYTVPVPAPIIPDPGTVTTTTTTTTTTSTTQLAQPQVALLETQLTPVKPERTHPGVEPVKMKAEHPGPKNRKTITKPLSESSAESDSDSDTKLKVVQRRSRRRSPTKKRATPQQTAMLEAAFQSGMIPDPETRKKLAEAVGFPERRVQIWFQNRRAKLRRGDKKNQVFIVNRGAEPFSPPKPKNI